jgi:hypothetical protein
VKKIRELVCEDRNRTIHELADTAGISYGACKEILTENLNWLHHYNNAPAHMSMKTTKFVTNNNMVIPLRITGFLDFAHHPETQ